jgi:hypothetical protein
MANPLGAGLDDWIVPEQTNTPSRVTASADDWFVPDAPPPSLTDRVERARGALDNNPVGRIEKAVGQGEVEGFGNEPLGITPGGETERALQKTGLLHTPGQPFEPVQAVSDFAIRHGAEGADAFFRAIGAGTEGIAAGAEQTARELGQSDVEARKLRGDVGTMEDLALMAPNPEIGLLHAEPPPRTLSTPEEIAAFNRAARAAPGAPAPPPSQTRTDIDEFLRQRAAREAAATGAPALPAPNDWIVPEETAAQQTTPPAQQPAPTVQQPANAAGGEQFPSLEEPGRVSPAPLVEIPEEPPKPPAPVNAGSNVLQSWLDDERPASAIRGQIEAEKQSAGQMSGTEAIPIPDQAGSAPDQTGVNPQPPATPPGTREAPVPLDTAAAVYQGAENTAEPTPGQAEAGNYRKRHVTWNGLDMAIETEAGGQRTGIGPDGQPWAVTLTSPYGYIKGTKGRDGEQIDAYLGPNPDSPHVFIADQIDPRAGAFDEHKALIGYPDESAARAAFEQGFQDDSGKRHLGALTRLTVEGFKDWLAKGVRREPVAYSDPVRAARSLANDIGLNATDAEIEQAAAHHLVSGADPLDRDALTDALAQIIERNAVAEEAESADSIQRQEALDDWQREPTAENASGAVAAPAGEPTGRAGEEEAGEAPAGVEPGEAERDRGAGERVERGRRNIQSTPVVRIGGENFIGENHEQALERAARGRGMGESVEDLVDGLGGWSKVRDQHFGYLDANDEFVTAQEAEALVTRDEAPAAPELAAPLDSRLTGKYLRAIAKEIPTMSAADRVPIRSALNDFMAEMERDGKKIAEHCLETGGKFSVRKRR